MPVLMWLWAEVGRRGMGSVGFGGGSCSAWSLQGPHSGLVLAIAAWAALERWEGALSPGLRGRGHVGGGPSAQGRDDGHPRPRDEEAGEPGAEGDGGGGEPQGTSTRMGRVA